MTNGSWRMIMQTPVEIDFQGMHGTPDVRASIAKHVAQLERRYGRVTACRVVLKGPSGHHRTGGLYEVNIHLTLPNGREVRSAALRPQTSATPIFGLPSTMPSSTRDDGSRIMSVVC